MKGQLCKTYIRPILLYVIEMFYLKRTEINDLKRFEGNIVKNLMDISNRCRTNKLFHAMNIEPTEHKIKLIKLDFFLRLDSNGLTNELINIWVIKTSKTT